VTSGGACVRNFLAHATLDEWWKPIFYTKEDFATVQILPNGSIVPVAYSGNFLPRALEFSASGSLMLHDLKLGAWGSGSLRLKYNFRDGMFFSRENL
jgi:hypothetical protein